MPIPHLVESESGNRFCTLDALHERAVAAAVAAMESEHRAPFLFRLKAADWILTWETNWRDDHEKIAYTRAIRLQMLAIECEMYTFSGEVWTAAPRPGDGIDKRLPPSERPDRQGSLIIMSFDKAGNWRNTVFAVKHAGTKRARLLARDDWHAIEGDREAQINRQEGRLVNMLRPYEPVFDDDEREVGSRPLSPAEVGEPDREEAELIFLIRQEWLKVYGR